MSQLIATIHTFDSYDDVRWSVAVYDLARSTEEGRLVLQRSGAHQGRGIEDPTSWILDTLSHASQELVAAKYPDIELPLTGRA